MGAERVYVAVDEQCRMEIVHESVEALESTMRTVRAVPDTARGAVGENDVGSMPRQVHTET